MQGSAIVVLILLTVAITEPLHAQSDNGLSFRFNAFTGMMNAYPEATQSEIDALTTSGYNETPYGVNLGMYLLRARRMHGLNADLFIHTLKNAQGDWSNYVTFSPTISNFFFLSRSFRGLYAIMDVGGVLLYSESSSPIPANTQMGFAGSGGIGLMIPFGFRFSIDVYSKYNYRMLMDGGGTLTNLSVGAGFQF